MILCSGKVYYDLLAAREKRHADDIALVRVEQLYPFAADQAAEILRAYSPTVELVWAQEEPKNMGPWRFLRDDLEPLTGARGALCGPARKRQSGHRIGQAPPAGAIGHPRRRFGRHYRVRPSRPLENRDPLTT